MSLESKSAWIYQALYNPAKIITVQSNSLKSQSHYNPTIPSYLGDFGMKKDGFAWARTLQTLTFSQVPYYPDYNLRIFQHTRLVSRVHILIITIHHTYYDNPQVIQMEPKIMYNHLHLASIPYAGLYDTRVKICRVSICIYRTIFSKQGVHILSPF